MSLSEGRCLELLKPFGERIEVNRQKPTATESWTVVYLHAHPARCGSVSILGQGASELGALRQAAERVQRFGVKGVELIFGNGRPVRAAAQV